MHLRFPYILFVALTVGCNSTDFGGSSSSGPATKEETAGEAAPSSATCIDGDQLKINWTGEVQECLIGEGKTYNFDLKKCAAMRQATSFECNWTSVINKLKELDLLTDVLKRDSETAKLVSCGESEDRRRIVVQWVKLEGDNVDCSKATNNPQITTGCYTKYRSNDAPPDNNASADVKAKFVYDCMNQL